MALIDVVVYGTFSVGYVCMLLLTERAAGRFVRNEIAIPPDRSIRIRTGVARQSPALRRVDRTPANYTAGKRNAA
ncbi:MAG: hypothetical protein Q8K99_06470 [Actinomycetota bacterium]|nr:hypothetical protein [Actinomycetota bacterium]